MAGYLVLRKFTGRHWLALAPSKLQSSRVCRNRLNVLRGCGYTSGSRHITPLTQRREFISNPISKTKLTLIRTITLIPTLTLLTLILVPPRRTEYWTSNNHPTNPNCTSKTTKLTAFRRTSPQNDPDNAILANRQMDRHTVIANTRGS